ncbi:hypothetical protein [Acidaminococcus timonensis]|uniref:hypothetical protein n=1 Tax=Acidaminococcus timonensis TaxID=1871002 RepID=UPI00307E1C33
MREKIKRFWSQLTRKRFENDDERLKTAQALIYFAIIVTMLNVAIIFAKSAIGVKTWLYIADVLHMDVKILIGRE